MADRGPDSRERDSREPVRSRNLGTARQARGSCRQAAGKTRFSSWGAVHVPKSTVSPSILASLPRKWGEEIAGYGEHCSARLGGRLAEREAR